jgi:hypothetical protein
MSPENFRAFRFFREEFIYLGSGAVVGHDSVAVVIHVQDEVLAHDGQANQCDIALRFHDSLSEFKTDEGPYKSSARAPEESY